MWPTQSRLNPETGVILKSLLSFFLVDQSVYASVYLVNVVEDNIIKVIAENA